MQVTGIRAARSITSWTGRAVFAAGFLLLLASPRDAAATCLNGQITQTVDNTGGAVAAGGILYDVLSSSTVPCTVTVLAGTYNAPPFGGAFPGYFTIPRGLTVKSASGPAATNLVSGTFTAVAIWPLNGSCPSGATLEGFSLNGPSGGVFVGADSINHVGCAANQVTGVTLRNLFVSNTLTPSNGHGIELSGVQNSVIDSCTVFKAFANGILLAGGSNNNIVMNSAVVTTATQHAIALQISNDNVIVGNTVNGADFDGILLNGLAIAGPGSSRNRIERNTISGHKQDGITLDRSSNFNYLGVNTAVSSPASGSGVGLWVNNASNGNYLFGNDVSGSFENGVDVLTSKSTYIQGNRVHGNHAGGIWVANVHDVTIDPAAPPPQDTVIQGNHVFFNETSGEIYLLGAINTEASYNYLSAAAGTTNGALAQTHSVGFQLQTSTTINVFENTVSEIGSRAFVFGDTTGTTFFRNRFLRGNNDPARTDGLNGLTFSLPPAGVTWDGGSFLGGNHWTEFAASGNPDPNHPFRGFIGNDGFGQPYADRFPYQSEGLPTTFVPNSVTVLEPVAGSVLAAGTTRTIHWVARGCTLVDLSYASGAGSVSIATAHPNIGFYFWAVPGGLAARSDYTVRVACANRDGAYLGVSGTSPTFTVASSALVLLNPGRNSRAANGGVVRVAWKASAAVTTAVNIYVKAGAGAETLVATATAGTTFRDITLPGGVSNSSQVSVRIQDAGGVGQDSVDGYFSVRGTPVFTTALSGTLQIGSIRVLEWAGPSNSYLVDLDLVGGSTTSIAKNLPDFGNYTWFVPDAASANATVRVTFKGATGNVLTTVSSGAFGVARNAGIPPPSSNTDAGPLHDFDGDGKTELTVFRPSNGTWYVRYSAQGYNAGTASAFQWGLPGDLPLSGDFDGDGQIELTVFRPSNGTWYVRYSSLGYSASTIDAFQWGLPGDMPLAADFDGDGKTDLTVYRPSSGTWFIRLSSQSYSIATAASFQWGLFGDLPLIGDFDGDGRSDLTVYRPSTGNWFIRLSSQLFNIATAATFQWGIFGDLPLMGDFDGDGRTDLTVFRPASGQWFIRLSSQLFNPATAATFQWGLSGDVPLIGDFDGDGRSELSVFRPSNGTWYVRYSSQLFNPATANAFQWGLPGDDMVR